MVAGVVKVSDGDASGAVQDVFAQLLESGVFDALVVDQRIASGGLVFPTLVSDAKKLDCDVFAPVLPTSAAKMLSKLTKFQGFEKPVGVVLRSCQMRALVELVKLNQASLHNVVLIGVECPGTVPINGVDAKDVSTRAVLDGKLDGRLRTACQVCKDPIPVSCDVRIGIVGVDTNKEIVFESLSEKGEEVLGSVKLGKSDALKGREKALDALRTEKAKKRLEFCEKVAEKGTDGLVSFFEKCVNCHNCKSVCPICYCKECLYESAVFDAEAYKYMRRSQRKGALKMPTDTLLFQLGRMHHMILSCVECGLCEQACPVGIPLMEGFIPAAEGSQREFGYHPGRDLEEKIPTIVYREDEYQEIGE